VGCGTRYSRGRPPGRPCDLGRSLGTTSSSDRSTGPNRRRQFPPCSTGSRAQGVDWRHRYPIGGHEILARERPLTLAMIIRLMALPAMEGRYQWYFARSTGPDGAPVRHHPASALPYDSLPWRVLGWERHAARHRAQSCRTIRAHDLDSPVRARRRGPPCGRCSGDMKLREIVTAPEHIARVLAEHGLAPRLPC